MSKNITIAEGGQAKTFTNVSHLKTNLIGGGTQYWVPEDEAGKYANVDEITITENGTYSARDEDLDGFSTVRVNVSGGGGDEPVLVTKTITQNGTYNASDDGADGYSSVTVNVQATHGRTIVNGINNAPVSQRISTRDFFDDLNEQAFAAISSYYTTDADKAWLQTYIREGGWMESLTDMLNYDNLVLVGIGGVSTTYGESKRPVMCVFVKGILDESGIVTISNATINHFDYAWNDGSKFTAHQKPLFVRTSIRGGASIYDRDWSDVKNDLATHNAGPSQIVSGTQSFIGSYLNDDYPHTPILTNLTGGTWA